MRIGIPAETRPGETRVAATPETVKKLLAGKHQVVSLQWCLRCPICHTGRGRVHSAVTCDQSNRNAWRARRGLPLRHELVKSLLE